MIKFQVNMINSWKVNGLRDTTNDLDNVTIIEDKYDKIKENQAEILKEKKEFVQPILVVFVLSQNHLECQ